MPHHHPLTLTRTVNLPAQPADRAIIALADKLADAGLDTLSPAWDDRGYLKIINTPGALAELTITTCGHFTWEYRPTSPGPDMPARITAVFLALLDPSARPEPATQPSVGHALFSQVGRALARCGLNVTLDILDVSEASYDIYSELAVTNPAHPERGTGSLGPDGTIWWECRTQLALTLRDIATAITRALAAAAL